MLGVLASHDLSYRVAYADAHVRAHVLEHSGHGWLSAAPLMASASFGVLILALLGSAAQRSGRYPREMLVALSVAAFVALEFAERALSGSHHGLFDLNTLLVGSALSAAFAYAASVLLPQVEEAARRSLAPLSGLQQASRVDVLPVVLYGDFFARFEGRLVAANPTRGPPAVTAGA